jgi:hypothetical protein
MHFVDLAYLTFITLAMCVTYFILLDLFPILFAQKIQPSLNRKSLLPILYIFAFSTLLYIVNFLIPDPEFANRILHVFGGGFLGFSVCFLATRDSGIHVSKFQFFILGILIVLALGVVNELLEFVLQIYGVVISSTSVTDTWLDLFSNTIGIILASICLIPFHK